MNGMSDKLVSDACSKWNTIHPLICIHNIRHLEAQEEFWNQKWWALRSSTIQFVTLQFCAITCVCVKMIIRGRPNSHTNCSFTLRILDMSQQLRSASLWRLRNLRGHSYKFRARPSPAPYGGSSFWPLLTMTSFFQLPLKFMTKGGM